MATNSFAARLDAALTRWRELAAHAGEAIDALAHDPAYLRLKTQGRAGALTGQSAVAATEAVAAVEQLWSWYLLLSGVLARADALSRGKGLFGGQDRAEEALALLEGPSIQLAAKPDGLAGRELTPTAGGSIPPEELLKQMNALFARARDLTLAAERGWDGLGLLAGYRKTAEALNAEAARLGCPAPAALSGAGRLMAETEAAIEADPIGAEALGSQIQELLAKGDAALAQPRADAIKAGAALDAAPQTLAALAELFADAARVREARITAVAGPPDAPALPDPSPVLHDWLAALLKTREAGQMRAVRIGVGKWIAAAGDARARLIAQREADRRLLAAREDLRGRYTALSAKARARRAQGLAPPEADALLTRGESLLYGCAAPLAEAAQVLRQLELALSRKDRSA